MLTREECESALDGLKEMIENCIGMRIEENEEFYIWISTLNLIIKEHFDNPPLKIDELEEYRNRVVELEKEVKELNECIDRNEKSYLFFNNNQYELIIKLEKALDKACEKLSLICSYSGECSKFYCLLNVCDGNCEAECNDKKHWKEWCMNDKTNENMLKGKYHRLKKE